MKKMKWNYFNEKMVDNDGVTWKFRVNSHCRCRGGFVTVVTHQKKHLSLILVENIAKSNPTLRDAYERNDDEMVKYLCKLDGDDMFNKFYIISTNHKYDFDGFDEKLIEELENE